MPIVFFQVRLSVQSQKGGTATISVPYVLQEKNYTFILVKEGGEEGIIQVDASEAELQQIGADYSCKKLILEEMRQIYNSYPQPKLKQKFKASTQQDASAEEGLSKPLFGTDEQGKQIVVTFQTVRAGFYLIDVPVLSNINNLFGE
jgi:hypothetical protein